MQNSYRKITEFLRSSYSVHERNLGWIDLARGFIIIMVVSRHSFEGIRNFGIDITPYRHLEALNNMMYTFRMPLFFVISGILMNLSLKKGGLEHYIRKRAEYILYPYVVWCIIQISLQLLMPQFVNNKAVWHSYLSILYNPRDIEQFWYLYALFNIMVIYSIAKIVLKIKPWIHILVALVFFLTAQYTYNQGIRLYFINDILGHYIFFAVGDLASAQVLNPKTREKLTSYKTLLVILPVFLALHYFYAVKPDIISSPFMLIITFSGIVTAIILSFILDKTKGIQWIKVLGANSLYIYLMHVIIMAANRVFMLKILHVESISIVLITNMIFGLFIPILAYNVLVKSGFWWLFSPNKPGTTKPFYAISVQPDKQSA